MSIPLRFILAIGASVALLGCSGGSSHDSRESSISLFRLLEGPVRTTDALAIESPSARVDLGPDWSMPPMPGPGSPAMLKGGQGDLEFVSDGAGEELVLRGSCPTSLGGGQGVRLTLNGVDLGHHALEPGPFVLRVELVEGALRSGLNTLDLVTDLHGSPKDHLEGATDDRDVGLGLDLLAVGPAGLDPDALELAVPGGGHFDRGSERVARLFLPGQLRLELAGVSDGAGSLRVELALDGEEPWSQRVPLAGEAWSWESDMIDVGRGHGTVRVTFEGDTKAYLAEAELKSLWEWPNLLLVSVDTLRADRVHGDGALELPTIGKLMDEGISFPSAFAHVPLTLPSHTTLFSSRLPYDTGVFKNGQLVPQSAMFLAEWMQRSGYRTRSASAIGTLWAPRPGAGLDRGFDVYEDDVLDILPGDAARDRGVAVMEDLDPADPFFMFLHFSDPHMPYNAHGTDSTELTIEIDGETELLEIADMKSWTKRLLFEPGAHEVRMTCAEPFVLRRFQAHTTGEERRRLDTEVTEGALFRPIKQTANVVQVDGDEAVEVELSGWISDNPKLKEAVRRYDLEVEYTDRMLGEVLDVLEHNGLMENTLVIFTSDHGEAFGEHGHVGHAEQLFDESLNVPLVMVPPADMPLRGLLEERSGELVRLVDIAPTALDLIGLPPMPGAVGRSLLEDADRVVYSEARPGEQFETVFALRDEEYLLLYSKDEDAFEMFDIQADPGQTEDVFAEAGSRRADWQGLLRDIAAGRVGSTAESVGGEDMAERLGALGY